MKFTKILLYDIKNGILKNKFFFISSIIFALFVCTQFKFDAYSIEISKGIKSTLGDYLCYIYGATRETIGKEFILPIIWLFLMTLSLFTVLNYPLDNLQGIGSQFMYRTGNRYTWWCSKYIWNIITTFCYHGIVILLIIIFAFATNVPLTLNLNRDILVYLHKMLDNTLIAGELNLYIKVVILTVLVSISINLFQMVLSFFIKPLFAFLFISIILVASSYIQTQFLIGNFGMILRNETIIQNGISTNIGFIVAISLIVISFTLGLKTIKHFDIINRE